MAADVNNVLGDVSPHLMVTDPPYGVDYDPTWRAIAGVNQNKKRLGKVANEGIRSARGGAWHASSVSNLLARAQRLNAFL